MGKGILKNISAAFGGYISTFVTSSTSLEAAPPSRTNGPPPNKRQRLNGGSESQAEPILISQSPDLRSSIRQSPRAGHLHSVPSTTESKASGPASMVGELRSMDQYIGDKGKARRRPREGRPQPSRPQARLQFRTPQKARRSATEDISMSDQSEDELAVTGTSRSERSLGVGRPGKLPASRTNVYFDPSDTALLATARRGGPPDEARNSRLRQARTNNPSVVDVDADAKDELCSPIAMSSRLPKKSTSESLSRRGDITTTLKKSRPSVPDIDVMQSNFPLVRASRTASYLYSIGPTARNLDGDPPLVVTAREVSTVLRATLRDGELPEEFDWLVITARLVMNVWYNPASTVVRVHERTYSGHNRPLGATLFLEFDTKDTANLFVNTLMVAVTEARSQSGWREIDAERLDRAWKLQWDEIEARPGPQPRQMQTANEGDVLPQDLQYVQKQQQKRDKERRERQMAGDTGTRSSSRRILEELSDSPRSTRSTNPFTGSAFAVPDDSDDDKGRRSRRRTRGEDLVSAPPLRWTREHPDWAKDWKAPLVYWRTTVEQEDISRLDEGECLNDNLIGFFLRYLEVELQTHNPEAAKRVYFYNSFFYEKLKPAKVRGEINYEGVSKWTAKVDIFSYDYLIVPVNEHFHWWVAIICNPGKLLEPDEDVEENEPEDDETAGDPTGEPSELKEDSDDDVRMIDQPIPAEGKELSDYAWVAPRSPTPAMVRQDSTSKTALEKEFRIVTLDSLGSPHSPAVGHFKQYLTAEAKVRRGIELEMPPKPGMQARHIPQQENFCDCGVYLLAFIQRFVDDPDEVARTLILKEDPKWTIKGSIMRNDIRDLIFKLQREYQRTHEDDRRKKAAAKRLRLSSSQAATSPVAGPSAQASPVPSVKASRETSARADVGSEDGYAQLRALSSEPKEVQETSAPASTYHSTAMFQLKSPDESPQGIAPSPPPRTSLDSVQPSPSPSAIAKSIEKDDDDDDDIQEIPKPSARSPYFPDTQAPEGRARLSSDTDMDMVPLIPSSPPRAQRGAGQSSSGLRTSTGPGRRAVHGRSSHFLRSPGSAKLARTSYLTDERIGEIRNVRVSRAQPGTTGHGGYKSSPSKASEPIDLTD